MENETRFNLNAAVARWRKNLQNSPALRPQDLEELEAHLRDSTQALHSRGLSLEEAFLVASRRLGSRQGLEREYAKLNVRDVWTHRAVWMLLGLLFFSLVAWCSHIITGTLVHLALSSSMSAHWIGFLSFGAKWVITALAVTALWRFVTQRDDWATRFALMCLRRPLLPILGIVSLNFAWLPFVRWLLQLTSPGSGAMELKGPILTAWAKWTSILDVVLWMAALTWLASAHWRNKEKSDLRQVWIERGLWMVGGMIFFGFLLSDLYIAAQKALLSLAQWSSLEGNWVALLVGVLWALIFGFVAAAWKFVSRSNTIRDRITRFGLERPALGFMGLLLLYFGFETGLLRLLAHAVPGGPLYPDYSLVVRWMDYGYLFVYNVISVAIFFWLARRRMQLE